MSHRFSGIFEKKTIALTGFYRKCLYLSTHFDPVPQKENIFLTPDSKDNDLKLELKCTM